jgi:chaperone required for assembly of F1-ATPase
LRVITWMHRRRRAIVWLSIAAAMLLGVGAQLHALSHALKAAQATTHSDPLAAHTQACDQCLQFAALDGAATASTAAAPAVAIAEGRHAAPAPRLHAARFSAYRSRAPPAPG